MFQQFAVEHCSVHMPADCYCFSRPKSSVALCRCLRTAIVSWAAIVSAVQNRALLCHDICELLVFQQTDVERALQISADRRPLLFQQSVNERCSMQMSAECYCFSNPSMSVLCADVCGLLLFQRSVVEHCSVEMSADCYCFSCRTSSVALCIVSAVRS